MQMVTAIFSADLTGKMRVRIFSRPLPLPLSLVDADDDHDDF